MLFKTQPRDRRHRQKAGPLVRGAFTLLCIHSRTSTKEITLTAQQDDQKVELREMLPVPSQGWHYFSTWPWNILRYDNTMSHREIQ